MKKINVSAAIILKDNKIFATQRAYGEFQGWWEFPGGKIEPKETPEAALIREIKEELDTLVSINRLLTIIDYDYPNFHLTMHCFLCTIEEGQLTLLEHSNAKWLDKEHLDTVNWLPADIEVISLLKNVLTD